MQAIRAVESDSSHALGLRIVAVYRSNWNLYAIYAGLESIPVGYRKRGWGGTEGHAVHADVEL